jgi:hypothetical protein
VARLRLIQPTEDDLREIGRNLREADRQELQATSEEAIDFPECLCTSVACSEIAYVAVAPDGTPVAVFGLAPVSLLGGVACPWMLGTPELERYGRDVVLLGKRFAREWCQKYDQLFNYVDARNTRAIAWLRHSGYTVFSPEPHGLFGEPFHRFERCT